MDKINIAIGNRVEYTGDSQYSDMKYIRNGAIGYVAGVSKDSHYSGKRILIVNMVNNGTWNIVETQLKIADPCVFDHS